MATRRDNSYWRTKHEGILEAAFGEFSARGFDLASMERIAELARVSKVTVYNHFATKEKLFKAAVEHYFEFLHEPFQYDTEGRPPGRAELAACIEKLIAYYFAPQQAAMLTLLRSERGRCASLGISRSERDLFPPAIVTIMAATISGQPVRARALAELICSVIHRNALETDPVRRIDGRKKSDIHSHVMVLLQDAELVEPA